LLMQYLLAPAVGTPEARLPSVYTAGHLIESGIYAALAVGLYLLVRTGWARRVLKGIRKLRLSLDGALLMVVAAVVVFAVLGSILGGPVGLFYPSPFSLFSR
jgi:hypothetical protein